MTFNFIFHQRDYRDYHEVIKAELTKKFQKLTETFNFK